MNTVDYKHAEIYAAEVEMLADVAKRTGPAVARHAWFDVTSRDGNAHHVQLNYVGADVLFDLGWSVKYATLQF